MYSFIGPSYFLSKYLSLFLDEQHFTANSDFRKKFIICNVCEGAFKLIGIQYTTGLQPRKHNYVYHTYNVRYACPACYQCITVTYMSDFYSHEAEPPCAHYQ